MKKRSSINTLSIDEIDEQELSTPHFLASLGPWGGSAIAHGAILIILLLWTIPIMQDGSLQLTMFTGVDDGEIEEMSFAVEDSSGADSDSDRDELTPPIDVLETVFEDTSLDVIDPQLEFPDLDPTDGPPKTTAELTTVVPSSGGSVGEANSVEEAVDRITGGIQGRLEDGDVLVVWLLDSSLSLQDDRQRVAQRLRAFLEASGRENAGKHKLLNAVAVFGRNFRETVAPTTSSQKVLHSIKNAPIDKSGKENVFLAVEKCVAKYRKRWKSQLMIVIWTDESGDDAARLDKTLGRAKQGDVAVSVVGRSAVLGSGEALQDWNDPKTGKYYQLPILNGPDSAQPERLRLGYWFRGPPPFSMRGRRRRFPAWYGNDDLIGLSSSFSPWALTRLAMETGGSYTLFDRANERAPYDAEKMSAYRPAYESLKSYRQELSQHPLRKAVSRAVRVTYSEEIETPDLMFFGLKSPIPPHPIQPLYFSPRAFQSKLSSSRGKISRQIKYARYSVEKALAHVSDPDDLEKGLEDAYEQEPSARWRAWYDVTRGRLLAVSIRLEEYRLAIDGAMRRDGLRETTNGIVMGPSSDMRSDGKFAERAEEARELLLRCVRDHADTPWAYLAERELAHGLGIQIRQMSYSSTGAMSKQSGPKIPKF